jgi:hypothetical protein
LSDNVTFQTATAATIPNSTVFSTDQLGSGAHVQHIKIMSGTADDTAVIPGDATNGLFVNVKTSVLPTGASTSAKQPALGTAGTASADVITIQGVASMTPVQVSLTQIGANATAAGNGATNTGTQRVTLANDSTGVLASISTSVVPGTGATHLGKAEDNSHSSGDTGVMLLAVRESTPVDLSSGNTNGDYEPLQVAGGGQLWTKPYGMVDSGGTEITDTTAHAVKVMQVKSDGTAVATAVDNTTDNIGCALQTDVIMNDLTALTPKFAKIAASSSGNNTLVAAVSSKKIRVLAYNFISNGTVNAKFQDGASGTDLTGLKYCVANMGICAPFNPVGWFETSATTLLNVNLSGAVAIGGELVYVEV